MDNVYSFIVVLILAQLSVTFGADVRPKNCAEERVLNLLTKWRGGDNLPAPLPSLEVMRLTSFDNIYEGFGIKITYRTGEMKLMGLNNFTVEKLSVYANYLKASTTLRFPLLTLTAEKYKLKGRAYIMYSIEGAGFMKVTFQNVVINLGITLVPKGNITQVDDIALNFSVGHVGINLADSSWPVNQVLNNRAMEIVEEYRNYVILASRERVKQELNTGLQRISTAQLLSTISKYNCNKPTSL